jgi:hypothetical protein
MPKPTMIELWDDFTPEEKNALCTRLQQTGHKKFIGIHQGLLGLVTIEEVLRAWVKPAYLGPNYAQGASTILPTGMGVPRPFTPGVFGGAGGLSAAQHQANMQALAQHQALYSARQALQQAQASMPNHSYSEIYVDELVKNEKKVSWWKCWFGFK